MKLSHSVSDTHCLIKVHVVGEDFDIGMEDTRLADHLLQDVSDPSREDEEGDANLIKVVKEHLEPFPVETSKQ